MKGLAALLLGGLGLRAWLTRRQRRFQPAAVTPADELRARLDAARSEPAPAAEPGPSPPASSADSRRRDVHERARRRLDELG